MTDHLSQSILSALADGELSSDQLVIANEHLAGCQSCTATALQFSLLKSSTAKAGHRYAPPPHLQERVRRLASASSPQKKQGSSATWRFSSLGWAAAAAILIIGISIAFIQQREQQSRLAAAQRAALVTEVFDQHVATMAAGTAPQVISTDRHTVKPWFQGKIPFSFNLPQNLPSNTTLDGADLTYLDNQPVAQLLYSLGKHRVSVFIRQKPPGASGSNEFQTNHAGFHVMEFTSNGLQVVAISDAEPARLSELVNALRQAQQN